MHLKIKGRIVGEHIYGRVINFKSAVFGLDNNRFVFIRYYPVQLCRRQLFAERDISEYDFVQKLPCLGNGGAFCENQRNKFIGS